MTINKQTAAGSHRSWVDLNKLTHFAHHLDSFQGTNKKSAEQLSNNINPEIRVKDVKVTQHLSMFKCGIHALANCRLAMASFLKNNANHSNSFQDSQECSETISLMTPNLTLHDQPHKMYSNS